MRAQATDPTVTMSLPLVSCACNRNYYAGCDKVKGVGIGLRKIELESSSEAGELSSRESR
jgi:hypothetical protein